tara:strand:+ start:1201 stop:1836 length:636 start_codon:yes stop_codon:yes gene_type:complete
MNVYQRLNLAREAFHGSKLKKTGHNKFANYYYFELGDFLIPALQIFNSHGLVGVVSFGKETADMRIINVDKPEEMIVIESPMSTAALKGCHEVQNLGAVQTYLRRYLWVAALEIVEHDAIDSSPKKEEGTKARAPFPIIAAGFGIGEDLPNEIKEFLQDLGGSVTELVKNGKAIDALAMIDEQQLEADQKVYLSNQLDAPTRSAIKKAKNG